MDLGACSELGQTGDRAQADFGELGTVEMTFE
jgi:hypothetical protein